MVIKSYIWLLGSVVTLPRKNIEMEDKYRLHKGEAVDVGKGKGCIRFKFKEKNVEIKRKMTRLKRLRLN